MAKKKQLAGKKTKLAELPLTRVLSRQVEEEAAPWGPTLPAGPPEAAARQISLTWEELEEGIAGLLSAAYLKIIQELADLQAALPPPAGEAALPPDPASPATLPPLPQLKQSLRQAREDLRHLQHLLS